jgi:uncharacterized repeat protein (TIGR01451 family)
MKKLILLNVAVIAVVASTTGQVIRAFTSRYNNPSVKGGIVYVSNSIVSTTGIGTGVPGTGEVPPTGTTVNGAAGINLDVDNPPNTVLYTYGSTWKYLDNNTRPANWNTVAFSDAAWTSNVGKFGYNSSQATCITSNCTPICTPATNCTKYITTLFRKVVSINTASYDSILLNVKRDDGIVIYVNGTEVARNNMPASAITNATVASSNIAVGAAESYAVTLPISSFVNGNNTIAVEVHLQIAKAADMSFDMEIEGVSLNGTFNSTTADLSLPSCSVVMFAGLYWGAGEGSGAQSTAWITGETTCKLKIPGASSYTTVTSSQTDYWNSTLIPGYAHTGYKCFKDITSLINTTSPNGTYTVANVLSPLGLSDAYGGWTIVIAYSNATVFEPVNLTVFDGCAAVKSGSGNVDVAISGFLTPASGPVSCELGTVVYDGDRGSSDGFQFKQTGAGAFYDMATTTVPLNGTGDAWNSKISSKGSVVTTRNPAYNNTLGYDASIFDLPNTSNAQLSNNQTGATVRYFSNSENVIVQVLSTAISQYNPNFIFEKSATDINGGSLVPGDSIRYKIKFTNVGNDSSTTSTIYDNIPVGTTFIPGSLKVSNVSKTDASGDDQAEYDFTNNRVVLRVGVGANAVTGGKVGKNVVDSVQFDVVVASSCHLVSCIGSISNSAKISYLGKTSGSSLYDSSGVNVSGCVTQGPLTLTLSGACFTPKDTLLVNKCTVGNVMLPYKKYAGYTFYSAKPFITANIYNPFTPVTATGVYYAYFSNGAGCADTARITVIVTQCPDIDDDNDGIPDYVEFNNPLALQDADGDGIPNWKDTDYPGFVDNNNDGVNDNFDWGADSNNDGIPNFQDKTFWTGWVDVNNDGVNDLSDKDLDGIPNQYDLDSDNDGIPDVVESYGVDTNGDGIIDNYTDTDNDGFSQNVDANNTGVAGSGNGLGAPDFDGDGIPNYLDLDSDNDGIPDLVEAGGTDANNDGMIDGFVDANGDGLDDNHVGVNALLKTGPDVNGDGRADSYPYKNKDNDAKPNPYDLDSDGDGIVDVVEAGLPDANLNGIVDGTIGANGWSTTVSSMGSFTPRDTDGDGYPDYLDIDSDNDGIPDNIEGQTTSGYISPTTADTDGDGIANVYDNINGYGGMGIAPFDFDGDGIPDYRDTDTDADGQMDIVEGNDFNLNGIADDLVTLTGIDTDGDGLDNRFDSLNSTTNLKGTSYRMGNGGSFAGDATPGSRCTVQKTYSWQPDRDWRFNGIVLPVETLQLNAAPQGNKVLLNWTIFSGTEIDHFEVERSPDNEHYQKVGSLSATVKLKEQQQFAYTDDISNVAGSILYYRLKVINKPSGSKMSNVQVVRRSTPSLAMAIIPNPVSDQLSVNFDAEKAGTITVLIVDNTGKTILSQRQNVSKGNNSVALTGLSRFSNGVYRLKLMVDDKLFTGNFILKN